MQTRGGQFLRFILSNIVVHCILRENIHIANALNNIPAPPPSELKTKDAWWCLDISGDINQ